MQTILSSDKFRPSCESKHNRDCISNMALNQMKTMAMDKLDQEQKHGAPATLALNKRPNKLNTTHLVANDVQETFG